jgi:hypothetical protein
MDISSPQNNTQPISDDQELAKALAGVLPGDSDDAAAAPVANLQFEETPTPMPTPMAQAPVAEPVVTPIAPVAMASSNDSSALDDIKLNALKELRPLMDKVELPAEEKFDTYLMLLRSTDDSTLIDPAHRAAQGISDEKRKAEALLEIIKEIDYLSRKEQPGA